MNTHLPSKSLAALSAAFLFAGAAQAASYVTQITGTFNGSYSLSRIEIDWSTPVAFGDPVDETDLTDLAISFYNSGDTLFYTDVAIAGGVRQPIGGISRNLAAIDFSAVSGVSIANIDNDLDQVQLGAATGTTYNVYGTASSSLNIASYINGSLQADNTFSVISQNTTAAIPESSACAALAGLLGLGFAAARRKRV